MRYLVKTYLGRPAKSQLSNLDTLWYDGNGFGLTTPAIDDNELCAVWGYYVDEMDASSPDMDAFKSQPTSLFGEGCSRVLWHNKVINDNEISQGCIWGDTNYFFGLTHETHMNSESKATTMSFIHAYNKFENVDDILAEVTNHNIYQSSVILWMYNISSHKTALNKDNIMTLSQVIYNDDLQYIAYHFIYDSQFKRVRFDNRHNFFDSLHSFSIYTLESAKPVNKNENAFPITSIRFYLGSVERSFMGYMPKDYNWDTLSWREGMSLLNWGTHNTYLSTANYSPNDSIICLTRSSYEELTDKYVKSLSNALYCPVDESHFQGSNAITNSLHITKKDEDDNKTGFLIDTQVLRIYNINNTNKNNTLYLEEDSPDTSFINDNSRDTSIVKNTTNSYTDTVTGWYQFIVI